jgi:hypothetical protein
LGASGAYPSQAIEFSVLLLSLATTRIIVAYFHLAVWIATAEFVWRGFPVLLSGHPDGDPPALDLDQGLLADLLLWVTAAVHRPAKGCHHGQRHQDQDKVEGDAQLEEEPPRLGLHRDGVDQRPKEGQVAAGVATGGLEVARQLRLILRSFNVKDDGAAVARRGVNRNNMDPSYGHVDGPRQPRH